MCEVPDVGIVLGDAVTLEDIRTDVAVRVEPEPDHLVLHVKLGDVVFRVQLKLDNVLGKLNKKLS